MACLHKFIHEVLEELSAPCGGESHETHLIEDFLCRLRNGAVRFQKFHGVVDDVAEFGLRLCHRYGDFVLVVLLRPRGHEVADMDKLVFVEADAEGGRIYGGMVAREVLFLPFGREGMEAPGFFGSGAGGLHGIFGVVLVFHDAGEEAASEAFCVGFEVGVGKAVRIAFLLRRVDDVQFADVFFAFAFDHAFGFDAPFVVQIMFMGDKIAAEGSGELRHVLGKLFGAGKGCVSRLRGDALIASCIARIGLGGELALCANRIGYVRGHRFASSFGSEVVGCLGVLREGVDVAEGELRGAHVAIGGDVVDKGIRLRLPVHTGCAVDVAASVGAFSS